MAENRPWGMDIPVFNMLMHLSQLLNFIIPFGGLIMPIIMWATQKELDKSIDLNGRIILNWMLSAFLYMLICLLLSIVGIGVFVMVALGIASLVFVIIGAIKANKGEAWPYPLSIDFFGVKSRMGGAG